MKREKEEVGREGKVVFLWHSVPRRPLASDQALKPPAHGVVWGTWCGQPPAGLYSPQEVSSHHLPEAVGTQRDHSAVDRSLWLVLHSTAVTKALLHQPRTDNRE